MKAIIFIFLMISTLAFSQSVTIQKEKIDLEFETSYLGGGDTMKIAEVEIVKLLNCYRKSEGLSEVKLTKKLWQWSYDQSFYNANLVRIGLMENKITKHYPNLYISGSPIDIHSQDYDIPNWEEQDRTQIPLRIRPFVGENVSFLIVKNQKGVTNQKELAKTILDAWISSYSHNDLLLYEKKHPDYHGNFNSVSVSFYKTKQFTVKKNGEILYTAHVISATMSLGVF